MLFDIGIDKSKRRVEKLFQKCSACGATNCVHLGIFQHYFYIYRIPCFPTGKSGAIQCDKCRVQIEQKDFTEEIKYEFEQLKRTTPAPLWSFLGVALFLVLVISLVYTLRQKSQRNEEYILSPEVGDVYEVKLSYKEYTLYKVQEIKGDTVYVYAHAYRTDKSNGLVSLKGKEYIEEPLMILKSELKAKLDSGEIQDVDR